jgi:hypothetical protein
MVRFDKQRAKECNFSIQTIARWRGTSSGVEIDTISFYIRCEI